ncbi:MAG TPA: peptidoglycan-binding domain-containing protein [Thermoanaerobaculia bacterium]|jgi:hypothetical protein
MRHTIVQGESVASVAFAHGLLPETVWSHPENAELRKLRADPYVLLPGDELFLPQREPKSVSAATGRRHVFRRKRVPDVLRVQLRDVDGQPRAGLRYVLDVDGVRRPPRTTDAEGFVAEPVAPNARRGVLCLGEDESERVELHFGRLDPISEITGVQARLQSLGFEVPESGELDARTALAIGRFQRAHKLPVTGEADAVTRERLDAIYRGSAA